MKEGVYALEELKHAGTCVVVEGEIRPAPENAAQVPQFCFVPPPRFLLRRVPVKAAAA